jgi:hypothetical protein
LNPYTFTGRVERLLGLIEGLSEEEAVEGKKVIIEIIQRNIQAYGLIKNYSRYETMSNIAGFELELYRELADKYPEFRKMFIE